MNDETIEVGRHPARLIRGWCCRTGKTRRSVCGRPLRNRGGRAQPDPDKAAEVPRAAERRASISISIRGASVQHWHTRTKTGEVADPGALVARAWLETNPRDGRALGRSWSQRVNVVPRRAASTAWSCASTKKSRLARSSAPFRRRRRLGIADGDAVRAEAGRAHRLGKHVRPRDAARR